MNIKFKDLTETQFIEKYLLLYNLSVDPSKRLVKSEIELVQEFALLPSKFEHSRFSSVGKNKVIESLSSKGETSTKASINSKIYDLIAKTFFYRDEDRVIYMPKHLLKALQEFRNNKAFVVNIQLCS